MPPVYQTCQRRPAQEAAAPPHQPHWQHREESRMKPWHKGGSLWMGTIPGRSPPHLACEHCSATMTPAAAWRQAKSACLIARPSSQPRPISSAPPGAAQSLHFFPQPLGMHPVMECTILGQAPCSLQSGCWLAAWRLGQRLRRPRGCCQQGPGVQRQAVPPARKARHRRPDQVAAPLPRQPHWRHMEDTMTTLWQAGHEPFPSPPKSV